MFPPAPLCTVEGLRHIFVLDTSWRASLEDQCLAEVRLGGGNGGRPPARVSRIDCQVATMKTVCCLEEPEAVGVVHMGSKVRMDVSPTASWRRRGSGAGGVLSTYSVAPLETEAPPSDDDGDGGNGGEPSACPERLPQALHLCVEKLRELRASDRAMYGKENEARITVFLSSPPRGMAAFAEELQELKEDLDALDAEVHFILHPDAYSPRFHAPMKDDKTLWDMTGCRSPYSQPRARALCSDEDMEALQDVTYEKFSWQVHMADFLSTLLDYRSHYFGQAFDIVETLLPRWEACYGSEGTPLLLPPFD